MSDYFLGEIRLFPYPDAGKVPRGWHLCDGTTLPINQNQALYSLLGTQFGGDGISTFNLPDLRGRAIVGQKPTNPSSPFFRQGAAGGTETVALVAANCPPHTHALNATSSAGNTAALKNSRIATNPPTPTVTPPTTENLYAPAPAAPAMLNDATVQATGAAAGHANMQPFVALAYCICVADGLYPPHAD